jgi:hypothetical protein
MSEPLATPSTDPQGAKRAHRSQQVRKRRAALSVSEASAGMATRLLSVRPADVVFVKGIIEASEGLALVFAERGGELTIAAPFEREADLVELVSDLAAELGGEVKAPPESASRAEGAEVAAASNALQSDESSLRL